MRLTPVRMARVMTQWEREELMRDAQAYVKMIQGDPFFGPMFASYQMGEPYWKGTVLDFGCGYGWGSDWIAGMCEQAVGYDPDAGRIAFARTAFQRENLCFLKDHAELYNRRYDAVCLFQVLPYVAEPAALLGELPRLLNPEGVLLFSMKQSASDTYRCLNAHASRRGWKPLYETQRPMPGNQVLDLGFQVPPDGFR